MGHFIKWPFNYKANVYCSCSFEDRGWENFCWESRKKFKIKIISSREIKETVLFCKMQLLSPVEIVWEFCILNKIILNK